MVDLMRAGWRLWRGGGSLTTLVGLSLAFAAILWLNRPQESAMESPPPAAVTFRSAAHTLLSALPDAGHPLGAPTTSGNVAADTFWVSGPVLDGTDGAPLGVYEARLLRDGRAWVLVDLEISYLSY